MAPFNSVPFSTQRPFINKDIAVNSSPVRAILLFLALTTVLTTGCGTPSTPPDTWVISVLNQGEAPVDVSVTYGTKTANSTSQGSANVGGLGPNKPATLAFGKSATVVQTVKVTRAGKTQELTPDAELKLGTKYVISIAKDGTATGNVSK